MERYLSPARSAQNDDSAPASAPRSRLRASLAGLPLEAQRELVAPRGELPPLPSLANATPVQMVKASTVDTTSPTKLAAMPLFEFMAYNERQADWHLRAHDGTSTTKDLRALFGYFKAHPAAEAAAAQWKLSSLVLWLVGGGSVVDADKGKELEAYGRGLRQETAKLLAEATLADALTVGKMVLKLEASPELQPVTVLLKHITRVGQVNWLAKNMTQFAPDFVAYVAATKPVLHAADGVELDSYYALRQDGLDPLTLTGPLSPFIRNYHRFHGGTLTTLAANAGDKTKSKPLTLALWSNVDYNGYLHRSPDLLAMVTNPNVFALLVEGQGTLADLGGKAASVAADYGQGGKVAQVVLSGHGSTDAIEMSGSVKATDAGIEQTKEDLANADQAPSKDATKGTAFINGLLDLLVAGTPTDQVPFLLRACLTNSQIVYAVDPLDPDTAKAAQQIRDQIAARPRLRETVERLAAIKGLEVAARGASASTRGSNGEVTIANAGGALEYVDTRDPALFDPDKLEYLKRGMEVDGVLRAAVEIWAQNPASGEAQGKACVDAMRDRLAGDLAAPTKASLVTLKVIFEGFVGGAIANNPTALVRASLGANAFPALIFPQFCSMDALSVSWFFHPPLFALTPALVAALQTSDLSGAPHARLLLANAKGYATNDFGDFIAETAAWKVPELRRYLNLNFIAPDQLAQASASAPTDSQLLWALVGVTNDPMHGLAEAFLREHLKGRDSFPDEPKVRGLLGGISPDEVLVKLGLKGAAALPTTEKTANVSLDGTTNRIFVEPMQRGGKLNNKTFFYKAPALDKRDVEKSKGVVVKIFGKTPDGWYALEYMGDARYVPVDTVDLT